ncbi:hypothetical protein [Thermoflavimicrobium dichotomicum]|uniref:DUF2281 domain-containing protein n=1 Tax=Thermoflavimicrobium dichotomicum TaxID=46223 RepID=A0A1I3SV75_9BACL|nr:hypothetical protein [Thermoflavimicrobium dichotomicum]SFJ62738.1 hypothetical protein SAMN05421852_11473 [Thermoflavimicrobium dichotomicum]
MMSHKEKFDHLFNQLSEEDRKSVLDYMEYLVTRAEQKMWEDIPDFNDPFSQENIREKKFEYLSLEELKRELNL